MSHENLKERLNTIAEDKMTENYTGDIAAAVNSEGFIDFYELLGVPGNATAELIGARVNDLYNRAQDNREHRHLAKRREAEQLLQLMPHCMDVLMDENNRVAYDAYAVAARAGAAPTSFDDFMNDVIKESPQARSGLLAIRDDSMNVAATASVVAAGAPTLSRDETRVSSPLNATSTARENAKPRKIVQKINYFTVAGVFAGVFVLCDLGLALPSGATLVVAPLSALVSVWMQRRQSRDTVSRAASQQVSV